MLDLRPHLTPSQASEVLLTAEHHHDATVGINWDVLGSHADRLFPEPDPKAILAEIRLAAANAVGAQDITECLDADGSGALTMLRERIEAHRDWSKKDLRNEEKVLGRAFEKLGGRGVDEAENLDSVRMALAVRAVCTPEQALDLLDEEIERLGNTPK